MKLEHKKTRHIGGFDLVSKRFLKLIYRLEKCW